MQVPHARPRPPRPPRALVAVAALTAVLALTAVPAGAAKPKGPTQCPKPFPLAEVQAGLKGTGWTVEKGTEPDPFSAKILGTLENVPVTGRKAIVAEIDSDAIRRAGGLWHGMSGSPVYALSGRLFGATAFTFSADSSRYVGITPAEYMYELLTIGEEPPPKDVLHPHGEDTQAAAAEQRAWGTDGTIQLNPEQQAQVQAMGIDAASAGSVTQIGMPVGVSGLPAEQLNGLAERLAGYGLRSELYAGATEVVGATEPSKAGTADDRARIKAGGNFGLSLSTGDATVSAVGTTTAVCHGRALAAGHTWQYDATTTMAAHTANALLVDPVSRPAKRAELGPVVGLVDQDRMAGQRALLGQAPTALPITSTTRSETGGQARTGRSDLYVQHLAGQVAFGHVYGNLLEVLEKDGEGTIRLRTTVTGTTVNPDTGTDDPFTLARDEVVADPGTDDSYSAVFLSSVSVASRLDALYANSFRTPTLRSVAMEIDAAEDYRIAKVTGVQVKDASGQYVKADPTAGLQATAGAPLELRVELTGRGLALATADLTVTPTTAGQTSLSLHGGGKSTGLPAAGVSPAAFPELVEELAQGARSNVVVAELGGISSPVPGVPSTGGTTVTVGTDRAVVGDALTLTVNVA